MGLLLALEARLHQQAQVHQADAHAGGPQSHTLHTPTVPSRHFEGNLDALSFTCHAAHTPAAPRSPQACVVALRKFTYLLRAVGLPLPAPHAAEAAPEPPHRRAPPGAPTEITTQADYGRFPLSVRFDADQVPFNLDNAASTTLETSGQPAAVAAPTGSDKRFGTLQV